MELVTPTIEFELSFKRFYDDYALNDVANAEYYVEGSNDFPLYINRLIDESHGLNLTKGYVPCSHFWLIDSDKNIVGAIRVRHNINNEFLSLEGGHIGYDIAPSSRGKGFGKLMLKLALSKAHSLGISKALITADEDNFASRKVIEANGGEFENIVTGKVFEGPLAKYWVHCDKAKSTTW